MATNDDMFWVADTAAGAEGPYLPGLRLHEVREEGQSRGAASVGVLIIGVPVFFLLWRLTGWAGFVPYLLILIAFSAFVVAPAFIRASRRYRLRDDNSDKYEFDGAPAALPDLLAKLASSDQLRARLTPPEVGATAPSAFWTLLPAWNGHRPVAVLVFLGFVLGQVLVVVDELVVEGTYSLEGGLALVGLLVLVAPLWWMHRRVQLGVGKLGTGDPVFDGEHRQAEFDAVSDAALRWDALLGKPYLVLELRGKSLRYYSPVSEPLYLLRLATYRMPHLTLQA